MPKDIDGIKLEKIFATFQLYNLAQTTKQLKSLSSACTCMFYKLYIATYKVYMRSSHIFIYVRITKPHKYRVNDNQYHCHIDSNYP